MALILWLPLIDGIENQGLADLPTPSYTNLTENANGKIGKCYYGAGLIYHLSDPNIIQNKWTLALWVKNTAWNQYNDILLCKNNADATNCQFYFSVQGGTQLNFGIYGNSTSGGTYKYTFEADTWYHLVATFDGTNYKMYINGDKVKEGTCSNTIFTNCVNLCVGNRSSNAGGTAQTGGTGTKYMNDVRIYDSVISDKEIQVLARGLMVHYPLDREGFGQNNLLSNTPKSIAPSTYCFAQLNLIPNLEANKTYTLQLWNVNVSHTGKTASQTGVSVYWGGGSISLFSWTGTSYFTNGHADYLVKTFTITEAQANHSNAVNAWLNIYNSVPNADGTRNATIERWKLEEGKIATPWMLNPEDDLCQFFEINNESVPHYTNGVVTSITLPNDIIVSDVSGYRYNGTKTDTGYFNDAPRYSLSTLFESTSSISIPPIFVSGQTIKKLTVSIWFKTDTLNGTAPNLWSIGQNSGIRTRIASKTSMWTYMRYYDGSTATMKSITQSLSNVESVIDNNWHNWVIVFDSGIISQYFDNKLQATADYSSTGIFLKFDSTLNWIGSYNGSAEKYVGSLSDFRLYTTALSAEAVAELYHTGASLANNGTLMTNQFVEV